MFTYRDAQKNSGNWIQFDYDNENKKDFAVSHYNLFWTDYEMFTCRDAQKEFAHIIGYGSNC